MKTTLLGGSAFVESKEDFLSVDVTSEEKYLRKQGVTNGERNFPKSDALNLDDVEHGIIKKIAHTVEQTQTNLRNHFTRFSERLTPIVGIQNQDQDALKNRIGGMPRKIKAVLDDMLGRFKTESAIEGPKWQHAQESYEKFRRDNNLIRPADYSPAKSIVCWVLSLILIEAALNATLFWELTGFLLAFGQTTLITVVNVVFGAIVLGFFLRCKNHALLRVRWLSLVSVPVVAVVLVFNFGVGHYRDALSEATAQSEKVLEPLDWDNANNDAINLGFLDYTQIAMDSVVNSFFGIDSILSALLIIIGVGFFGLAAYKCYSVWDVYPGYRKADIILKKAYKKYESFVHTTRNQMKEEIANAIDRVVDENTTVTNMQIQRAELIDRANALIESYTSWCVAMEKTQTMLVEIYRSSNRQTRSESAPEYFNSAISIDSTLTKSPTFNPPERGDVEDVVKTVKSSEAEINKIADNAWDKFNILANMQQHADKSVELT